MLSDTQNNIATINKRLGALLNKQEKTTALPTSLSINLGQMAESPSKIDVNKRFSSVTSKASSVGGRVNRVQEQVEAINEEAAEAFEALEALRFD